MMDRMMEPAGVSERLGALTLEVEEPALAPAAADVLAEPAVLGQDAVAGDHDRHRVLPQGRHDLLATAGPAGGLGDLPAGAGPAVGDLGGLLEHAPREQADARGREIELQAELAAGAGEVLGEPAEHLVQEVRAVDLVERNEGTLRPIRLARL